MICSSPTPRPESLVLSQLQGVKLNQELTSHPYQAGRTSSVTCSRFLCTKVTVLKRQSYLIGASLCRKDGTRGWYLTTLILVQPPPPALCQNIYHLATNRKEN